MSWVGARLSSVARLEVNCRGGHGASRAVVPDLEIKTAVMDMTIEFDRRVHDAHNRGTTTFEAAWATSVETIANITSTRHSTARGYRRGAPRSIATPHRPRPFPLRPYAP
eukprot:7427347-Pyramimonas_sp.AAC.1